MLEIPADADALGEHLQGASGGTCLGVRKSYTCVDPIADGIHPLPPGVGAPEQLERDRRQQVHLAVPAGHEVAQHVGRQVGEIDLRLPTGSLSSRVPGSSISVRPCRRAVPGRQLQPGRLIAEQVVKQLHVHCRFHPQQVGLPQIPERGTSGRAAAWSSPWALAGRSQVVAETDEHDYLLAGSVPVMHGHAAAPRLGMMGWTRANSRRERIA